MIRPARGVYGIYKKGKGEVWNLRCNFLKLGGRGGIMTEIGNYRN